MQHAGARSKFPEEDLPEALVALWFAPHTAILLSFGAHAPNDPSVTLIARLAARNVWSGRRRDFLWREKPS